MTTPDIQSPVVPDLRALLDSFKVELFSAFNSHKVGTIVAFDKDSGPKASVQISALAQVNGKQIAYPVLTDCPVIVLGGGGATIQFPIGIGDPCLIFFNDFDLDNWFTTGASVTPNTSRTHSLSDALVLVGVRNLANKVSGYSASNLQIKYQGAVIELTSNGDANISLGSGKTFSAYTADGGSIQVNDKIRVGNTTTNLLVVLNDLANALTAWVNTGGSTPNAATIAAINAVKAEFATLLV